MKWCSRVLLLMILVSPLNVRAQGEQRTPADTVRAFHQALASGNEEKVLELLDPEVTIFESGGAELSREEYASHHLGADIKFSAATDRKVIDQREGGDGDAAWVLTRSETQGSFREKDIDILGTETIVLRYTQTGWRIVHVHWSSRPRASSH